MLPAQRGETPDNTCASRPWPLPETPATPRISPASMASATSINCTRAPWALSAWTCKRGRSAVRGLAASRCSPTTDWPTIQRASSALFVAAVSASATTLPPRSTSTRCEMAITSSSLWLMKMTAMPCATSWRKVTNRLWLSCGVSTAVGSSSTSTRAPRYSALRISTRCRSPTDSLATRASGSSARPERCATSCSLASACDCRVTGLASDSVPSMTLSRTLRLSASVKCWCTMPTPAASAARVSPGSSGRPKTWVLPASAT